MVRIRNLLVAAGLVAALAVGLLAGRALEKMGNPDPTGDPASTSSYTLEDIYNRLDTGAPGTPSVFTEPTSGPGTGTMHTLNEIMGKAGTACTQCTGTLSALGRWCDNGNGTVTDMTTGLVWLKKADCGGKKKWEDCTDHDDAHTRAGILYAGATGADLSDGSVVGDWRFPTKSELYALTHGTEAIRCDSGPCDLYGFTGVKSAYYWSSTTYSTSQPELAVIVSMISGSEVSPIKSSEDYVWPVRGGQ
jgi:hypothetical protein